MTQFKKISCLHLQKIIVASVSAFVFFISFLIGKIEMPLCFFSCFLLFWIRLSLPSVVEISRGSVTCQAALLARHPRHEASPFAHACTPVRSLVLGFRPKERFSRKRAVPSLGRYEVNPSLPSFAPSGRFSHSSHM